MSHVSALSSTSHNLINPTALSIMPPESRVELIAISRPIEYAAGEAIQRQGDASHSVHVLRYGHAKVFTSSRDGKALFVKITSAGEIMGLGPVVRHKPYETTSEAYGPCIVDAILDTDFVAFLSRHSNACWRVLQMLAEENQQLLVNARRVALSATVAGNVARLLLDWEMSVVPIHGTKHFNMVLTHQEIAEMVGTTRETVTRTIGRFRREGWIRVHGASVQILQPQKMNALSN